MIDDGTECPRPVGLINEPTLQTLTALKKPNANLGKGLNGIILLGN